MASNLHSVNKLSSLLEGIVDSEISEELSVTGLSLDSRSVKRGELFLGMPGHSQDGRSYLRQAVSRGARAVLIEKQGNPIQECEIPFYQVSNLRENIGFIANRFYGSPSQFLCVIGVTGTNGKTTCAHFAAQALNLLGGVCGLIGTLGIGRYDDLIPSSLTTPDPIVLQGELAAMVEGGMDTVCMEVSSHALDQARVKGIDFDIAVFTNLSRDHLDYHGDMEKYAAAKFSLFNDYQIKNVIINVSDPYGVKFLKAGIKGKVWTFGLDNHADVYPSSTEILERGIRLEIVTPDGPINFEVPVLGRLNVVNLVTVVVILLSLGKSLASIERVMPQLRSINGRMELITEPNFPINVVLDYAHTPAALECALSSLREHTSNNIWCVFGCGGERDTGKRLEMGSVADGLADRIVLTNDNPRSENPHTILDHIAAGILDHEAVKIPDREKAIEYAISNANVGDLVLIAGKGHEVDQVLETGPRPFSDRFVVNKILEAIC